jgi:hypothetical protein
MGNNTPYSTKPDASWSRSVFSFFVFSCGFAVVVYITPAIVVDLPWGKSVQVNSWSYVPATLLAVLLALHCLALLSRGVAKIIVLCGDILRHFANRSQLASTLSRLRYFLSGIELKNTIRQYGLPHIDPDPSRGYSYWLAFEVVRMYDDRLRMAAVYLDAIGVGVISLGDLGGIFGSANAVVIGIELFTVAVLIELFLMRYSGDDLPARMSARTPRLSHLILATMRSLVFLAGAGFLAKVLLQDWLVAIARESGMVLEWYALAPVAISVTFAILVLLNGLVPRRIIAISVLAVLGLGFPSAWAAMRRLRCWLDPNRYEMYAARGEELGFRIHSADGRFTPFELWWAINIWPFFRQWVNKSNRLVIPLNLLAIGLARFMPIRVGSSAIFLAVTASVALAGIRFLGGLLGPNLWWSLAASPTTFLTPQEMDRKFNDALQEFHEFTGRTS